MMQAQTPGFCRHQAREYSAATQTKVSQTASEAAHRACTADTRATFASANSRCISAAELSPPAAKTHDLSMVAPAVGRSPRSSANMLPPRRQRAPPAAALPLVALLALPLLAGNAVADAAASGSSAAVYLPRCYTDKGSSITGMADAPAHCQFCSVDCRTLPSLLQLVLRICSICVACCCEHSMGGSADPTTPRASTCSLDLAPGDDVCIRCRHGAAVARHSTVFCGSRSWAAAAQRDDAGEPAAPRRADRRRSAPHLPDAHTAACCSVVAIT